MTRQRCQGHTLCSMIAPGFVRAQRHRRHLVAGERSGSAPTRRTRSAKPRTHVPNRPSHRRLTAASRRSEKHWETSLERRRRQAADDDRKKNTVPLRPAHPGVPRAVRQDHRGDAVQVPDGVDRRLQRALGRRGQQARLRAGALPGRSPTITTSPARRRLPGHHHPEGAAGHGRARRHPGDGRARAQHLPRCAEPVPVPRRDQAVAALRRRDRPRGPRREDRVGPHRLRRRPRQHRARGAHAGDDGHRAREVADLQRARAPARCPPRNTRPTPRASPR